MTDVLDDALAQLADDELRRRLDGYITACRALPPKGRGRQIGALAAVIVARVDLRRGLDRLAEDCGVERL